MRTVVRLAPLWVVLGTACTPLPGEVVGTYAVAMRLIDNTCGAAAVHPLDGNRYDVELREDADEAYWRIPGQPPIPGTYEAPRFRFEYASVVATGSADAGMSGCRLVQTEQLSGSVDVDEALDGGSEPASTDAEAGVPDDGGIPEGYALQGTHELTISAESGGDCREALAPTGAFERLPCVVRYELVGKARKSL